MTKRFNWAYIVFLIISSFFIEVERPNLLLHLLNIVPTIFLFFIYLQHRSKPFSLEDYLVLSPLIFFPMSETILYVFTKNPNEPLVLLLNGIYFFMVHICFVIIYRIEGGRVLSFTKADYYQVFPIVIATFLVFGFTFLPIIPEQFLFLAMLIATMLAILLTHIINRPIRGKSYFYGLAGGSLIAVSDFFAGYNAFFACNPQIYILYRFAFFLGLLCLLESLFAKQQAFSLNSQEEFFAEHKQQKQPFN